MLTLENGESLISEGILESSRALQGPRDPLMALTDIVLWYAAYRKLPFTKVHTVTLGQLLTEAVAYLEEKSRNPSPATEPRKEK
jgi:hypothetical protein